MTDSRRRLMALALALTLLAAGCGVPSGPGILVPSVEPGMFRIIVTPEQTEILLLETFPVQVRLSVTGELPNPCARLGWSVSPGDDQGRIEVMVYADQPSDTACVQVLAPYAETIPLGTFESGSYGVFVNGQQAEEFVLP